MVTVPFSSKSVYASKLHCTGTANCNFECEITSSVDKGDGDEEIFINRETVACNLKVSGMNFPSSLKRSVVLSLVLEEVTDDEEGDDVIDGDENDVADDDHDGLVVSALKRQESLGELEQQGCEFHVLMKIP